MNLADAIVVTAATTGKVISEISVNVPSLSAAQKTALVAFITSLGASWPGQAAHITSLSVFRTPGAPNTVAANVMGFVVQNDAATAITQRTAGTTTDIVGIVP